MVLPAIFFLPMEIVPAGRNKQPSDRDVYPSDRDMDGTERSIGLPAVSLSAMLAEELERGARLACGLDPEAYRCAPGNSGSIGAHIRHDLDLVECFLKGLREGRIDYSSRERDTAVEREPARAAARTRSLVGQLRSIEGRESEPILIRSEIDPGVNHRSTVGRELEFLYSHTVHHHAIIGERLRQLGLTADTEFGVAPSTLRYWSRRAGEPGV